MPNMTLNLARLGLVFFVALPIGANAETADLPPLPKRNVFRTPAGTAAKPVLPGDQPTMPWTEAQIANAAAKCKTLLSGDPLDYDLLPPIKEGMCGTPAPVLLRAVGHHPKVTINPPAILSCPMADVLGEWLRDTVQPEAKAVFGSAVAKIQNSSSYVCRNRYAGAGTPLSEHALANAFDVSEFVLTNGVRISVLDHWPRVVATPTAPKPTRSAGATARLPPQLQGRRSAMASSPPNPTTAPPLPSLRAAMASSPRRRPGRTSRRRSRRNLRPIPTHSTTTRLSLLLPSLRAAIAMPLLTRRRPGRASRPRLRRNRRQIPRANSSPICTRTPAAVLVQC